MEKKLTRRQLLKAAGAGAAMALLAACTPSPTATPAKPAATTAAGTKAPAATTAPAKPADIADKQVVKIAFEGGLGDGWFPGRDVGCRPLLPYCFMSPFMNDANEDPKPWLCTKFESSADKKQWTFKLDPRAKWSDGKQVVAKDLVDWWNYVSDPKFKNWVPNTIMPYVTGLKDRLEGKATTIAGIKLIDDGTFQMNLDYADGSMAWRMGLPWAGVGRLDQYQADEKCWLAEKAKDLIVNGPFKTVHMAPEPEAKYVWEANPKWWGDKKPWITGMEGTTLRDQQTMSLMFENGDIDIAMNISGGPAVNLRKKMPEAFIETKGTGIWACDLNVTRAPTDDKFLRQALFHAIDWEKMAQVAWEGEQPAAIAGGLITPVWKCYDANWKPYPMDVNKAKELLAKSKYAGKVPKIRISTAGSDPNRIRAVQILQEFWRVNLGIEDVEIKNAESEFGDTGKALINLYTLSAGGAMPHNFAASLVDPTSVHVKQFSGWQAPELNTQAMALAGLDPSAAEYCPAVQKVMKAISDEAVYLPLGWIKGFVQRQKWVKNYAVNWGGVWFNFMDGYLAKR